MPLLSGMGSLTTNILEKGEAYQDRNRTPPRHFAPIPSYAFSASPLTFYPPPSHEQRRFTQTQGHCQRLSQNAR